MISHRHERVNHPTHANIGFYDSNEPKRQILYLDANNLYGHAMMQYLPTSDFKWSTKTTMSETEIQSLKPNEEYGSMLKIDYTIPKEKHDKFANYPIASERKGVRGYMLSEYQKGILREQFLGDNNQLTDEMLKDKINAYTSSEKLILDLLPKQNYILHYRTLQLYLQLGIQITHIHRILWFKQQP